MTSDGEGFRAAARRESDAKGGRPKWEPWHKWTIGSLVVFTGCVIAVGSSLPRADPEAMRQSAKRKTSAQACSAGGSERDAQLATAIKLLRAPRPDAEPIPDPKPLRSGDSSIAVGEDIPLRLMCEEGDWARVRVLASGLRWMEGWVPTSSLAELDVDADGYRVLTRSDIEWQPGSERDKAAIVKIANRILREDDRCEAIDGRSLLVEGTGRGKRYTLGCDGPVSAAVTFAASDVTGRSFKMAAVDPNAPPINKTTAVSSCVEAIESKLHQPRSADFRTFSDTTFFTEGARARVTIGFTAKNGFGNEIDQLAACTFEGMTVTAAEILPSTR